MVHKPIPNQTPRSILSFEELWKGCEAVLFDFDGVLADSEPFYRRSWNAALEPLGHSVPEKDYWKHWSFLGEGLQGEIRRSGLIVPDEAVLRKRQKALYTGYCLKGMIPLFPLAGEVLALVMGEKRCAIASNTDESLVRTIATGALDPLPTVIGGDGLRSKPAPDIFLKASGILGVEPGKCLVVEDAWKGISAARAAGMRAILVRNRYNMTLEENINDLEIIGLAHLLRLVMENRCLAK